MTDFLETTIDKFTFRVATDRLYTREGLWVLDLRHPGGRRVRVGLADFLQQSSGDLAFMTVKPAGTSLQAGDAFAVMETIKATQDLASPVSGAIAAVNSSLALNPEIVNQSPYENGWLAEIDTANGEAERASLLGPDAYFAVMKSQAEEEAGKA